MLTSIMDELESIRDNTESLLLHREDNGDAIEDLKLRSEIESSLTSFTLLFQKMDEIKRTFEYLRDGYIKFLAEDANKEKQNG